MGLVKQSWTGTPEATTFDAVGILRFANVATVDANAASTTIQARMLLPIAVKVPLVAVACSALNALTGHKFNIALGTATTYAGGAPPTDNSLTGPPPGGCGYPTVFGAAGQSLFATDQTLTATAGVGVASSTLQPALATPTASGGIWRFTPDNPDAVIPAGTILTLRVVTPASTGSITNLDVSFAYIPVRTKQQILNTGNTIVAGVDW